MPDPHEVTRMLQEINDGSVTSPERLLPLVYDELRRLAQAYMQNERPDHTLQATALVHDAYIRLVDWQNVSWESRAQFFALAAHVMRQILVNHAVKRKALKRDFGSRIELTEDVSFTGERNIDVIALNEALDALAQIDPRQAQIVESRFFGGLTIDETAHVLKLSSATVKREWAIAKTWLYRRLKK